MTILTLAYRSTNYYLLNSGTATLLIDAGWAGTLGEFMHVLRRKDIRLEDIAYLLVTHYHPDHAGLAEDIKVAGVQLVVLPEQIPFISAFNKMIKPGIPFTPVETAGNLIITQNSSRAFLRSRGFAGEIVLTPGHSDDSVSLVLDSGEAFIGDLPPDYYNDNDETICQSWQKLKQLGITTVYHAHVPPFSTRM